MCVIEHYLGVKFALMDPSSPLKHCHRETTIKVFQNNRTDIEAGTGDF